MFSTVQQPDALCTVFRFPRECVSIPKRCRNPDCRGSFVSLPITRSQHTPIDTRAYNLAQGHGDITEPRDVSLSEFIE